MELNELLTAFKAGEISRLELEKGLIQLDVNVCEFWGAIHQICPEIFHSRRRSFLQARLVTNQRTAPSGQRLRPF